MFAKRIHMRGRKTSFLTLPLSSSMQIPPAAKYVKARVVEARNLISMDSNGFSDPFTVVIFNDNKKDARTTEIIYKTLNPVWADTNEFTFRVVSSLTDTLKFVVWDFDKIGLNDYEGQVTVPIAAAAAKPGEPLDSWVPLVNKKVTGIGFVR